MTRKRWSERAPAGEGLMSTPLEELPFPVRCAYPDCNAGPFHTGIEVDEHISEEHLMEAVWTFAQENMRSTLE